MFSDSAADFCVLGWYISLPIFTHQQQHWSVCNLATLLFLLCLSFTRFSGVSRRYKKRRGSPLAVLHLTLWDIQLQAPHTGQSTNNQPLTVRLAAAAGVTAWQIQYCLFFFWTARGDGSVFSVLQASFPEWTLRNPVWFQAHWVSKSSIHPTSLRTDFRADFDWFLPCIRIGEL